MSIKLLGISGSLSRASKTETAVQKALIVANEQDQSIDTELVALSRYDMIFCDGRNPDHYEGDTRAVIDKIAAADALIVGSPIYRGTFSGAFKNLFDLIPNDALEGKAIGVIATGGSYHHYLAIEHQFKPLFSYFKAYTVPAGVYATNDHFSEGLLTDSTLIQRLKNLTEETVRLTSLLNQNYKGPGHPAIKREALTES